VPLGQALLAGFQWVFEDLRGRFRLLWNDVLGDFYNDLVVNLTGAGAALAEQALASVERRAREAKGLTPAEWAALNPAGRATAVSHWRMKPGNWGASWGLEATRQAGAGLAGVAAGLPFAQKRPGDQIRAETAAAAGAALGRFLEAMGRTEAQLAKLTDALVPVTGPMAGGFRSPAPAGAEQAVDPAALRTARAYAQKVSVAGQLEKAGYVAQAAEAWQQAAALRQEMEELLPTMLQNDLRMNQQLKSITAQVRRLQTRYKRLATGRT